jgi:hypothetical protein
MTFSLRRRATSSCNGSASVCKQKRARKRGKNRLGDFAKPTWSSAVTYGGDWIDESAKQARWWLSLALLGFFYGCGLKRRRRLRLGLKGGGGCWSRYLCGALACGSRQIMRKSCALAVDSIEWSPARTGGGRRLTSGPRVAVSVSAGPSCRWHRGERGGA